MKEFIFGNRGYDMERNRDIEYIKQKVVSVVLSKDDGNGNKNRYMKGTNKKY
jgi:hypothetical protein